MKKFNDRTLIILILSCLFAIPCIAEPLDNRTIPERPSGAVIFNSDYCGCQAGKPITIGACDNFCASTGQQESYINETLFASVDLTTAITEAQFGNLTGWCTQEIIDPKTGLPVAEAPSCSLQAMDEYGYITDLGSPIINSDNSIKADISDLSYDQTYRIKLVERTSGAESTVFQIRKFYRINRDHITGPLQVAPINRYSCGIRSGRSTSTNQMSFDRFHLFFNAETRPDPLREETIGSFFCHDLGPSPVTNPLPPTNSPLLDETTGVFALWDKNDPRFMDRDADGRYDINQIIEQEIKLQGNSLPANLDLFKPLNWLSAFDDVDPAPGETPTNEVIVVNEELGFYMSSFLRGVDGNFRSFCPKQADYFGSNPLFSAMRKVIPIDTEALYVAKEVNACDFLLINKSVVEKIWFYQENGLRIAPTDLTITGKKIHFFWPANFSSPFVKAPNQRKYTIRPANNIAGTCSNSPVVTSNTLPTDFFVHDKRIGCIPMLSSGK